MNKLPAAKPRGIESNEKVPLNNSYEHEISSIPGFPIAGNTVRWSTTQSSQPSQDPSRPIFPSFSQDTSSDLPNDYGITSEIFED